MAQQNITIGPADAKDGDTLRSAFTKTEANFTELYAELSAQPENLRVINSEADFDTQDATTITLTPGLLYQLGASFSTAKRFITTGGIMRGLGAATTLTYTGTGSMFTNTNGVFNISNTVVDCPASTVFECIGDDSSNPEHRVNATSILVLNCVKLLTSTGAGGQVFELMQITNVTGLTAVSFSGSSPSIAYSFLRVAFIGMIASSTVFDFGSSTSIQIDIDSVIVLGDASTTAISGLTNSGNVIPGSLASVRACNFGSLTSPLFNIAVNDVRWDFQGNSGVKNTMNAADIFLTGGSETIITGSAGDWQEIGIPGGGGVSWSSDISDRFTAAADGVLTYIGELDIQATLMGRATVEKSGGGANVLEVRFAVNWNGTVSDGGLVKSRAQTQSADPTTVPIGALTTLSTNDNIRVIFSNTDGTSNIIASVASVEITG